MRLPCRIQLKDRGLVGGDDGSATLSSTLMLITVANAFIESDIVIDRYSGEVTAMVMRDDFHLPERLMETLLIATYWASSGTMREHDCELGEAFCDFRSVINRVFDRADADELIQKLSATAFMSASRCN